MADLNRLKEVCDEKLVLFDSLLRRYNPAGKNPVGLQAKHEKWDEELSSVLSDLTKSVMFMVDKHKVVLGTTNAISDWKKQVELSEKKYHDNFKE